MNKGFRLFPEQASTIAPEIDLLYFFLIAVSLIFFVLICVTFYVFAMKYRRRSDDDRPAEIHGNLKLEIAWSVIPFILVMIMFAWGAHLFVKVYTVSDDALEIFVVGKQWMWHFQHPTGHREINELHIPIGQPVKLTMASEDVIHSLFIPDFRIKMDVVPGRYTSMGFEATKAGEYYLFCAEYCGTNHSRMTGRVVVLEEGEYQNWLSGGAAEETPEQTGARLFTQFNCITCHGEQTGARGPSLAGVFGTDASLVGGQRVEVDEKYIRESVLNPRAKILAGYQPIMPTYQGQITEAGILDIIAYIKSLKTARTE